MCGITGIIDHRLSLDDLKQSGKKMLDTINYRGPDAEGIWTSIDDKLVLGHRRLAIQDLSEHGAQPMLSHSGRYNIVFNGEIYNFKDISQELAKLGHTFRGHSDTEVLLESISEWGLSTTLQKLNGMFAFALWDKQEKELYLCRDRLGEKPLYYGLVDKALYFSSELIAIETVVENNKLNIDTLALNSYLKYGYINAPLSIYQNIFKLIPGTTLKITAKDIAQNALPEPNPFWSVLDVANQGLKNQITSEDEAVDSLDSLLNKTIHNQMIADVNVGTFLSGGIDSSLVSAIAQKQSDQSINTFTIGFHEKEYDESGYAEQIAKHINSNHQTVHVGSKDALEVIPLLASIYDEPFADSSQIPTYLVSKIAKQHVTVCLSGDGGDELFSGYNRYMWLASLWNKLKIMPTWLRNLIGKLLDIPSPVVWDKLYSIIKLGNSDQNFRLIGLKVQKLAGLLKESSINNSYDHLLSFWSNRTDLLLPSAYSAYSNIPQHFPATSNFIDDAMFWDQTSYLPGDNLTKVDRASMAVSLETRLPLLSHEVVELSWRFPLSHKVKQNTGKRVLRKVLDRYVPSELIDRPKMGFSVPIAKWLRADLKSWAEDLLFSKSLFDETFSLAEIQKTWKEHQSGSYDHSNRLWTLLMLMSWKSNRT